jgi:hypothetical protein
MARTVPERILREYAKAVPNVFFDLRILANSGLVPWGVDYSDAEGLGEVTVERTDTTDIDAADLDLTADLFFIADVTFDVAPDGIIWEQGGTSSGLFLGVTSGELIFRAGGGSARPNADHNAVAVDAAPYAGKRVLIHGLLSFGGNAIWLFTQIADNDSGTPTGPAKLVGTDSGASSWSAWAGSNVGSFGELSSTMVVGESTAAWNGTAHRLKIYNPGTTAPWPPSIALAIRRRSEVHFVSDDRVLDFGGRLQDQYNTALVGTWTGVLRYITGLQGWSSYAQTLDILERKITTGQVDFVITASQLAREFVAVCPLANKLATLGLIVPTQGQPTVMEDAWESIAGLWVTDVKQDGAAIVISARDGRDLSRLSDATHLLRDQLPDHPHEFVRAVYDETLTGVSIGLSTTTTDGHLMMQRNDLEGGVAEILDRSGIGSDITGAFFGTDHVQFHWRASQDPRETTQKDLVGEAMAHADQTLYWSPDSRVASALEYDPNGAVGFTLGPDDYSDFEQLSTYEDVINRVLVNVPDPFDTGRLSEGYLEFRDDESANDLAAVAFPGASPIASDFYRDHVIDAWEIGHGFLWPQLEDDAAENAQRLEPGRSVWISYRKSRYTLGSSATHITMPFPELCGLSGTSSRTDGNKNLTSSRKATFAIGQLYLRGENANQIAAPTVFPPELVEATAYANPAPFDTAMTFNGSTISLTNGTEDIYSRSYLGGGVTIGSVYRYGRFTVTRGVRGTTARDWVCDETEGRLLYLWDLTAVMRKVDRILQRHAYGVPRVRFRVPRALGIQMEIGDRVSLSGARFVRLGRPLGAGGGGATDVFEVSSIQDARGDMAIEAAWMRGSGSVSVIERASANRTPRIPGITTETPASGGWRFPVSGTGATAAAAATAGDTYDISNYVSGFPDQIIAVEVDVLTHYDESGQRISIYRIVAEVFWDTSAVTLSIRTQSSTLVYGSALPHDYEVYVSGLSIEVRITQSGSGTFRHTWGGAFIGQLAP